MFGRNEQLDGLRGFAATFVAVSHTVLGMKESQIQTILYPTIQSLSEPYALATKLVLILFPGDVAVSIFFILSGAVLFRSLLSKKGEAGAGTITMFVIKRLLRIYPAFFISLLICFSSFRLLGIELPISSLIENLALYSFNVNGATWTLNVEIVAIPVFLIAYLVFRRYCELGLLIFFLLLWALSGLSWLKPHPEIARGSIFCFALGMFIPTSVGRSIAERLPTFIWPILVLVMLLSRHLIEGVKTGSNIQQIAAALFVLLLYYDKIGSLSSLLTKSASQFLGRISYSFYLYQTLFQVFICYYFRNFSWTPNHTLEAGLIASFIVVLLTIPVAWISTIFLENPAIRFGKGFAVKHSSAQAFNK